MRSILHAAAVVAASAGLVVPVALAQSAKPEPGCAGIYADKKGDVEYANLDITGFWFRTDAGKLTANIRIADLHTTLPDGATGASWYVLWNDGEAQKFAQVLVEAPLYEPSFHIGTVNATGNTTQRTREVDSTGQFIEGADGVISVDVPSDIAPSGMQLKSVTSDTKYSIGIPGVLSSLQSVDDAAGKTYTVNACEAGGAPAPGPAPAPAPAPQPSPSNTDREVAAGKLDVAVSKKVPKAKKVKKALKLSLKSKGGVTEVDAALFKGAINKKKIVAQGKLARAKGKTKLKLKVTKKLKKGAYTLYLVGKNADGTAADKSFKLKFK